ncbi:MAG: hypothetical protein HW380_2935 [Magnetococcales bacterium]|nr:hypothetical protein [Magnetococcales bacterium]
MPTMGLGPELHAWHWLANPKAVPQVGWSQHKIFLPSHALGRFSHWMSPLTGLAIRRVCPNPGAVVLTFPNQWGILSGLRCPWAIYYASDDFSTAYGWSSDHVRTWESRIVTKVQRVIVVSKALAERFEMLYHMPRDRILIVPNGVPEAAIPQQFSSIPLPSPQPVPSTFRPLAGVLGTFSSRLHIAWLRQAVETLPWLHWVFVGPVENIHPEDQVDFIYLQSHPRCCFTGYIPYERLFDFAASFDVALIPFKNEGINPASSPVRLFCQLPFGQPILATPGCRQLEEFEPWVTMCRTPVQLTETLVSLAARQFDDGLRAARFGESKFHTWEKRGEKLAEMFA